jgi:hypothetical protein
MSKGPDFEREIPKELSLWWTHGERDDVFWRVKGSGSRAKRRLREKGKTTYGQHGDIKAEDPIGDPLLQVITLELKNGYGKWSFLDVLDRPPMRKGQKHRTLQCFEKFMEQVQEDSEVVGTYPCLICKRDKRQKFIVLPLMLYADISCKMGEYIGYAITIETTEIIKQPMIALDYQSFLSWCSPEYFKNYKRQTK